MSSINKVRYMGTDYDILGEELPTKANIDGYYEDMTVGDAEQLVSSAFVEDKVPYNFRTTGGSADVGNREYVDGIVGGSIVWNQLVNSSITSLSNNGVTFTHNNGKWDISGTATGRVQTTVIFDRFNTIAGHKYFMGISKDIAPFRIRENNGSLQQTATSKVLACTEGKLTYFTFDSTTDISETSVDIKDVDITITDLTAALGSTIADYIYSLEQATAGAGVAWFKKLFPNMDAEYSYPEDSFDEESPLITKKLRDYQPGVLLSIDGLASHDTVGFNQWDEIAEAGTYSNTGAPISSASEIRSKNYIKVISGQTYYFKSPKTLYVTKYDANYVCLGETGVLNGTRTFDDNVKYIRFCTGGSYGGTYKNDICINLSWSGWRNGEYEEYQKHSYPLDDSLTLRGIPKLDAQNNLYYDGDRYLPDGTVTHYWKEVTYNGSEEWAKDTNRAGYCRFYYRDDSIKVLTDYRGNIINSRGYGTANTYAIAYDPTDDVLVTGYPISGSANWVYIAVKESMNISTVDAFKAWLAQKPVTLVLQLATPTTETAEPYQKVQICDDFGTEEYVSTSIVPVGHNTRYPANLRDKLQHLPDLADDDGYYMIGQNNKQMHLELFRIPKAPTSPDGTYVLKATVSGGTPTYTWEAQT